MKEDASAEFPPIAVRRYSSYRQLDVGGLILLLAVMLPAALVIGYLLHLIRPIVYLPVIFPLITGGVLACIGAVLIGRFRFPHALPACCIGVLAAVVAVVSSHYFDYLSFLSLIRFQTLKAMLAPRAFLGFVDLQAQQGEGIILVRSGAVFEFSFGHVGTYLYWIVELALIASLAGFVMRKRAIEPVCGLCKRWKRDQFLGKMGLDSKKAVSAVSSGNLEEIARIYKADGDRGPSLSAWVCEQCAADGEVELRLVERLGRNENVLTCVTCSGQVLPHLETIFFSPDESTEEEEELKAQQS